MPETSKIAPIQPYHQAVTFWVREVIAATYFCPTEPLLLHEWSRYSARARRNQREGSDGGRGRSHRELARGKLLVKKRKWKGWLKKEMKTSGKERHREADKHKERERGREREQGTHQ